MQTQLLQQQYAMVKGSREAVFGYCEMMRAEDFRKSLDLFGRGSICNTLSHVADTYTFWLGRFPLHETDGKITVHEIRDIKDLKLVYAKVNSLVELFLGKYQKVPEVPITGFVPGLSAEKTYSALQLFSHVITHEFHHKGQVMTMGRILGYTPPPDADIIRF